MTITDKFDGKHVFFTSDQHFDHEAIIDLCKRPFESTREMNQGLISRWNEAVGEDDIVFILGDFCWSKEQLRWEKLMDKLNGRKYLIQGNHDKAKAIPHNKLVGVYDLADIIVTYDDKDYQISLCHYPIEEWRNYFRSSFHLFGHTHQIDGTNDRYKIKKNSLNIGVDNTNFAPISFEAVLNRITYNNANLK